MAWHRRLHRDQASPNSCGWLDVPYQWMCGCSTSYLWQRAMLVEYASHHVQHMHKALTQMNVKLQHVISDITGRTGMDIIEALVLSQP